MHTLAILGFLAVGLFAAAVIFWEVWRKRYQIAQVLRYHPDEPAPRTNWWEVYYTGLLIAGLIVLFLVRS